MRYCVAMSLKARRWTRLLLLTTAIAQLTIVALAPALEAHVSQTRQASVAAALTDEPGGVAHDSGCAACAVMNAVWELGSPPSHLTPAGVTERPQAAGVEVAVRAAVRSVQLPRAPPTDVA